MGKYIFTRILDETIEQVKEKYKDINEDIFNQLLNLNPKFDGYNVDNNGRWILNLYKKGNLKEEDFYKVSDLLEKFEQNKRYLNQKDLNQYKDLPSLFNALENVQVTQTKSEIKRNIKKTDIEKDAKLVASTSKYNIYTPLTYEASCKLGAGTSWCTATNSTSGYYESYTSQGPLFILVDKSSGKAEYQFHFQSDSFMDKSDKPINLGELTKEDKALEDFVIKEIKENYDPDSSAYKDIVLNNSFADKFIDEVKEWYNKDNWIIGDIMKNESLNKYFEKEIEDQLKKHGSYARTLVWNKDYALGKFKEEIMKYFGFKEGETGFAIKNKWLATKLEKVLKERNSREHFSEEFLEKCLSGDLYDEFYTSDYAPNASDVEGYIDNDVENLLESLHLTLENIPQRLLSIAYEEGELIGMQDQYYNKFIECLTESAHGIRFELGYENSTWYLTYEQFLDLIYKNQNEEDFEYYNINVVDFLMWYVSKDFYYYDDFRGYYDFSEEAFNDRLYDEISENIKTGDEDPEFEDEEDLEKWKEWFKNR